MNKYLHLRPVLLAWLTLMSLWISNNIFYSVWDETTYPLRVVTITTAKQSKIQFFAYFVYCMSMSRYVIISTRKFREFYWWKTQLHISKMYQHMHIPQWRCFPHGRPFVALPWWRHQLETFSLLLALCAGNSLVTGEIPAQRPVTRCFDVVFDLSLNKRLN